MMNTKNELLNQKNNIVNNLNTELNLNYHYYINSKDFEFGVEDHYFKLCLFALYRAIEEEINIIIDDRKENSDIKKIYNLLYKKNRRTYWLDSVEFEIIFDELTKYTKDITYKKIIEQINSLKYIQKIMINEITRSHSQNSTVTFEYFKGKYDDCKKNRNALMHKITSTDNNLTKTSIINAFIVYSYLYLIIDKLF